MKLTVQSAAALLGKSPRTIRHLAQRGQIPACRVGARWVFDAAELEATLGLAGADPRREQVERVRDALEAAIDDVTPPTADGAERSFYSVRDMRTHTLAVELLAAAVKLAETATPAPLADIPTDAIRALRACIRALADGCHQFHPAHKLQRYVEARSHAARAVADLVTWSALTDCAPAAALADRVEGELLRALRALLRRAERRGKAPESAPEATA